MTSPPMTPIKPGSQIIFRESNDASIFREAYLKVDDTARIFSDEWTSAELRQIADHMDRQAAPERKP